MMNKSSLGYITAAVLIVAAGAAHGVWTDRWHVSDEMMAAAARVPSVPLSIGDWEGEDLEVSEQAMAQTQAFGYLTRRYKNRTSGQTLQVMLLCGRTGPLAVHPPTVCFQGTGFEAEAPEERYRLMADSTRSWGEFFRAVFARHQPGSTSRSRLYWAWSSDAMEWKAPAQPRLAFVGKPYLYKLYVLRELSPLEGTGAQRESSEEDASIEFLKDFLPEAKRALRSAGQPAAPSDAG